MPLKHWAKLAMTVRATASLVLVALVVAPAGRHWPTGGRGTGGGGMRNMGLRRRGRRVWRLPQNAPTGMCDDRPSNLPIIAVFARTNVNDRRAAWLNQFR